MSIGKFEACENQDIAELLQDISINGGCDEELGDVETFGWYGLIKQVSGIGKFKSFIIHEDNYGFFDYTEYDKVSEALEAWNKLESEYETFNSEIED